MKYLHPISEKKADTLLKSIYREIKASFPGPIAPPYKMHSIDSKLLSIYWEMNKYVYFSGKMSRTLKDVIAAGVSEVNKCPFCFESHTELLRFADQNLKTAFRTKNTHLIKDPYAKQLAELSLNINNPDILNSRDVWYHKKDKAEVIGIILMFNYTNILTNIFLNESVIPLPKAFGLRNMMWKLASPMMKKAFQLRFDQVEYKNEKSILKKLDWASDDPIISDCFSRLYLYVEEASTFIDDTIKSAVNQRINGWNGENYGLNLNSKINEWIEEDDPQKEQLLRLIYKTCFGSYQVTKNDISAISSKYEEQQILIIVSWSAVQICKKISIWL